MVLSTVEGDKDPPFLTSQSPPLTLTLLVTAPQGRGDYCPHFRAKESKVQAMRKYECRTGHPGRCDHLLSAPRADLPQSGAFGQGRCSVAQDPKVSL